VLAAGDTDTLPRSITVDHALGHLTPREFARRRHPTTDAEAA
jgi:hypothetical protein